MTRRPSAAGIAAQNRLMASCALTTQRRRLRAAKWELDHLYRVVHQSLPRLGH
jgi:hypothetical protein